MEWGEGRSVRVLCRGAGLYDASPTYHHTTGAAGSAENVKMMQA